MKSFPLTHAVPGHDGASGGFACAASIAFVIK
jgi:hypothetical protein